MTEATNVGLSTPLPEEASFGARSCRKTSACPAIGSQEYEQTGSQRGSHHDVFAYLADWVSPRPAREELDPELGRPAYVTERRRNQSWDVVKDVHKVILWDDDHFDPNTTDPEMPWRALFNEGSYLKMMDGVPTGTPIEKAMG